MKTQKQLPNEFTFICDEHSREQLEKLGVDLAGFEVCDIETYYFVKNNEIQWNDSRYDVNYPIIKLSDYLDQEQTELSGTIPASDRVITSVVSIGLNGSMNINPIEQPKQKWQEKTRGGYEYHIYEEFEGNLFGRVKLTEGDWACLYWYNNGNYSNIEKHSWDLIPHNPLLTTLEKELEEVRLKEKEILEKIEQLKTK